jgi:hypothetical protein
MSLTSLNCGDILSDLCPHRVHTERSWSLSGVHSIMMVKSAQAGEGGGCTARPSPFTLSTITYKVVVYSSAEKAGTLPLLLLYPFISSVVVPSELDIGFPGKK